MSHTSKRVRMQESSNVVMTTLNKFHAERTEGFHSKKERNRYRDLCLLQRGGLIDGLEVQKLYEFWIEGIRVGAYILDFKYFDKEKGGHVHEDVKGYKKGPAYDLFRLKKNLMRAIYGIEIIEL